MSDQEIENELDKQKEEAIAKHMSDIKVMDKCIFAIDEFIIRFGRYSNAHDQAFDLKQQIIINKNHLKEWVDKI